MIERDFKLGIIMPSNNPSGAINNLAPSLKHISKLSPFSTWSVVFQPPWKEMKIIEFLSLLRGNGFRYEYQVDKEAPSKPVNIMRLRDRCCQMVPASNVFLFIDDDFIFSGGTKKFHYTSGDRYLQSVDYMLRFPECGVVNTKGFLGGHQHGLKIKPSFGDMYATNRGLFLRNMRKHGHLLVPSFMTNIRGGLEETACVFTRIASGYFAAKQMNNPTIHFPGKLSDYNNKPDDFHNWDVINRSFASVIRSAWDDQDWHYEKKKLPAKLIEDYKNNGGPDVKNNIEQYAIDYGDSNV